MNDLCNFIRYVNQHNSQCVVVMVLAQISGNLSFWFFFFATLKTYGGFQARGQIGAVADGLCHSHSSVGSEPFP